MSFYKVGTRNHTAGVLYCFCNIIIDMLRAITNVPSLGFGQKSEEKVNNWKTIPSIS